MNRYILIIVLAGLPFAPAFGQPRFYNTRLAAWEKLGPFRFQQQWLSLHAARFRAERDGYISQREMKKLYRKKEKLRRDIRYYRNRQVPFSMSPA